jgi:glucokinase
VTQTIGIDMGGTKTAAIRLTADGVVRARARRPTPYGSPQELVATLAELVEELRTDDVSAVGVGLPGLVEPAIGMLAFAPRPLLRDFPLRDLLHDAVRLPVVVENDTDAAVWAERELGAGRGYDDILMLAPGTGLGCGVISGGRGFGGSRGLAVEIWHLLVEPGNPTCFGDLASGTAITALGRAAAAEHPGSLLRSLAAGDPTRVTGEFVTQAARAGDDAAIGILARAGELLGIGVASLVMLFDPAIVVVGGGPSAAGELLLGPMRESYRRALPVGPDRSALEIVVAQLGNEAAAVGAALLAARHLP